MAAEISKVGKRGTVVIPAELRRQFGIDEGDLVSAEAHEGGILIHRVVAVPVDDQRRRCLLEATNQAYAALKTDPEAWRAERAERALWDATLADGLAQEEVWGEDGDVRIVPRDPDG